MNSLLPKISIIMPFYNAADFLDQAIGSIMNQIFGDFELILINDGSTDGSDNIVKKYLSDPRIVYLKNSNNIGIVKNLNKGLEVARTDFIARMDGDDISEKTRLAKLYNFLNENQDISAVGSFIKIIDKNGKEIDKRTKPIDFNFMKDNILIYSPLVHASTMFRKSAVVDVGKYWQEHLYCEDLDLFYRLVFSGYKLANIPEYLYQYRYHENSVAHQSKTVAKKLYQLRQKTIKEFGLKIRFKVKFLIYLQYLVGVIFSGRQRQYLEGLYKNIFYHGK